MTTLRRTLIELVLLSAPLVGCDTHETEHIDAPIGSTDTCAQFPLMLTREVAEPPPAHLVDQVRACETDPRACDNLCWTILYAEIQNTTSLVSCAVTHSPTKHTINVGYCNSYAEGRRPPGLASARRRCLDAAGAHFARAAFFEAASVHAFVQLARELTYHRAPRSLIESVRRAAADEIRHARVMARLAHARGATPPPLSVTRPRRRSIEAIAAENAREGLVGETWSAMTAVWQAQHAPTAELRAAYAEIAGDEVRHAEISVAIAAWARTRLRPAARARVDAERARAVTRLARSVRRPANPELVRELGVPDHASAQRLFAKARPQLWAA